MANKDQILVLVGIVLSALIAICMMTLLVYGGYLLAKWATGDSRVHHVDCSVAEFSLDQPEPIKDQCRQLRTRKL